MEQRKNINRGLKKLIESIQRKQVDGEWDDSCIVKESNEADITEIDIP